MARFIFDTNPLPPSGESMSLVPPGQGGGLNFAIDVDGYGPGMEGPLPFASFTLNDGASKQWLSSQSLKGILPVGTSSISWRLNQRPDDNQWNFLSGIDVWVYSDLTIEVVDDTIPESIQVESLFIRMADGRVLPGIPTDLNDGDKLAGAFGTVRVSASILPDPHWIYLDFPGNDGILVATQATPIQVPATNATWMVASFDCVFSGKLKLPHGQNSIQGMVRTPENIVLAKSDELTFTVKALPTISDFSINNGDLSTRSKDVTLFYKVTGKPTEYQVSELNTFADAVWQPIIPKPSFTLTPGNVKKLFFRVRSPVGESAIASDTIVLKETIPPTILTMAINNGSAYTTTRAVILNLSASGSPTEFIASESPGFSGATWQVWSVAPSFTLTSGDGPKTIYLKGRNSAGESAIISDTIILNEIFPPTASNFAINNGAVSTITKAVTLNLTVTGNPTEYLASESSNFAGATWKAWITSPSFTLSSGNGKKTLFVKVRNSAGVSAVVSDSIDLNELFPPTASNFSINNGAANTISKTVTLNLNVTGNPTEYMVGESSNFAGAAWQAWTATPSFTLSSGNGRKTLFVKVRNSAGVSAVVSDSIDLNEVVPPTASNLAINNGATSTITKAVTLNITVTGNPTEYMASESPNFAAATWKAWTASPSFTLSVGNEKKTVYIKVRNSAGVSGVVSDSIDLSEVVPPTAGNFAINNGAANTTSKTVTLNLTVTGNPTEYMVSDSSNFAGATWQAWAATPSFILSSGNGKKTLFVKVRNSAGVSAVVSDSIDLNEVVPPTAGNFAINNGAANTTSKTVTLNLTVTGNPTEYMVSDSSNFAGATWQAWTATPSFILSSGNGKKTLFVKVRNSAGVSTVVSDSIDLNEVVPPTASNFAINNGAATTTTRGVVLNHSASGNPTEYKASESSNFAGATWQTWTASPSFTLSTGKGKKTVYLKVRNSAGESEIVSDVIELK